MPLDQDNIVDPVGQDSFVQTLGREALAEIQLRKLQMVLDHVLRSNAFYGDLVRGAGISRSQDVATMADYARLPLTTKADLSADQATHPPYGTNLTCGQQRYTHIHQTSGTTGHPLRWLDTDASWAWWARCWETVFRAAGVGGDDRVFIAFSFGPFIGFWGGYEAARQVGAMVLPGGGMTTQQRVKFMDVNRATVLVSTPSYALHLAEVAEEIGVDIAGGDVRVTIHAGEAGAGIPATRRRIEAAWGATTFDHAGSTEVGAWGFECSEQSGLHVNESEFIAEVLDPATGEAAEEGELVISNLGRACMPVIRYCTGDRVRRGAPGCPCGRTYTRIPGGVIGRIDDAISVRGVNIFPSAIEDIVRRFPEVGEFCVDITRQDRLDEIELRLEVRGTDFDPVARSIAAEFRHAMGLRVHVHPVHRDVDDGPVFGVRRGDDHPPVPVRVRDGGGDAAGAVAVLAFAVVVVVIGVVVVVAAG